MKQIDQNNKIFNNSNLKGKKKKKTLDLKSIILSAIIFSLVTNGISTGINYAETTLSAKNYVAKTYLEVELPYSYVTTSNGDYFYSNGKEIDLKDGLELIINDLTKQGASLEEIYYYLGNKYPSLMQTVFKEDLKDNNLELNLKDFRNKTYYDEKYNEAVAKRGIK